MNKEIKEKLINELKKTLENELENEDEHETEDDKSRIFASNGTVEIVGKRSELCAIYTMITKALIEEGIMDDEDIKQAHDLAKMSNEEIIKKVIKKILEM